MTRGSWSRFNTGETNVDFGRGRAASSAAMAIYGHGRRGAPVTLLLIHPQPSLPHSLTPSLPAGPSLGVVVVVVGVVVVVVGNEKLRLR